MNFRYEIYDIDNNELLWDRSSSNSQFNLEISILTNLSKGDIIKLSNEFKIVLVKKEVEFEFEEIPLMILRLWMRNEDVSNDLSKIPEWWAGILEPISI